VHPENWKRCRVYNSERMWVQTVYHELAHYVFWSDAERKADAFTSRMVRGLKRPFRRIGRSSSRLGLQRSAARIRRPAQVRPRRPRSLSDNRSVIRFRGRTRWA
jgi:hypothetical protein